MPTTLPEKKPPKQDWSLFILVVTLSLVLGAALGALCARDFTIPTIASVESP